MEFLIIGLAVAANIIFILFKYERERYTDMTLDMLLLITIAILFSGSYGALVIGTIASLVISIYLYFSPPKIPDLGINLSLDTEDLKRRFRKRY